MTTAQTPAGRTVEVDIVEHGTARIQFGKLYYGGVFVSGWGGNGQVTKQYAIEDALAAADEKIDKNGLSDDTASMSVRAVPEAIRLMFRGKALQEGKTMQEKIIELMGQYVNG